MKVIHREYANLPVIGTSEAVLGTSPLGAMNRILITVVATIVVTVAKPVRFHADIRLLALEVIQRTRGVAGTTLVRLVGRNVVLAIVDAVADLRLRDAAVIGTGKLARGTGWINASFLVAAVPAIVLVIALPRFKYASAVVATELVRAARVIS